MAINVSIDDLRSFLISRHSLDNYEKLNGKSGVKKFFKRAGSIQYDPLNIVGRNPNLVLQSRINNFNSAVLDNLLYKERYLVDAWDKEMSIYAAEDWPFFMRVRKQIDESYKHTLAHRGQPEVLGYSKQIIAELKKRGPLGAKDIDFGNCQAGSWGHKKIAGAGLDYLFSIGKLGVYSRKNAIRTYDLIENIIPAKILNVKEPFSGNQEFLKWYVLRRIGSIGIHWLRNGLGWNGYFINDKKKRTEVFKLLEKSDSIIPVNVSELNETFYMRREEHNTLGRKNDYDNNVRFLAPLDNLLWDRLMVKKLFSFEYSWEVYLPAEKRKYG